MKKYLMFAKGAFALLLLVVPGVSAQRGAAPEFAADLIPAALRAGDPVLVERLREHRFAVDGPGNATETVRRVVTILKPEGREDGGTEVVFYDKFRKVRSLTGRILDLRGNEVRKMRSTDVSDLSGVSGGSLYDDYRLRVLSLLHDQYPYTVEIQYEVRYDGLQGWPTWYPQPSEHPVERSTFTLDAKNGVAVRHLARGLDLAPTVTEARGRTLYRWEASLLPKFKSEPHGPAWGEQAASVMTAPASFEVDGKRGSMESWEAFSSFFSALWQGRHVLPPAARADVARITEGITEEREKVRLLYRYLQEKTRYVSVQLGIGGWQPYDATYVHTRGYGDCKALTNYLRALLAEAGIESYPALIRAGRRARPVVAEFPSSQFNHVILYVPLAGGPLWLEATSQIAPFGHLGDFTEDRLSLIVKPQGGELVRTPRLAATDNRQIREARVTLTPEGNAAADVQTKYVGNQQDRVRGALHGRSARDRDQWLHGELGLPSFEVISADFSSVDARSDTVALGLALRLPRYASRSGSRLFAPLNLMERWGHVPEPAAARTQPVEYFPFEFEDHDVVHYALPDGYGVEALPEPIVIEMPFARYAASASIADDGTLRYERHLQAHGTTIPADQYEAFRGFVQRVVQADRAQAVLVRK